MNMDKLRIALCAFLMLGLAACGFHLRHGAQLPASMQKIHLSVSGNGDLERELARSLEISGARLVDARVRAWPNSACRWRGSVPMR